MYKFQNHIPDYDIPLKSEIPCIKYDVSVFCDHLKYVIEIPYPSYLKDFYEVVNHFAGQVKSSKPKSFPNGFRVYIMDYRLNILFATIDLTGKIATFFSKYGYNARLIDDHYYGDGSLIRAMFPVASELIAVKYGFIPAEELARSTILIFKNEILEEKRLISQYQVSLLMEKYRSKNLVDWKELVRQNKEDFPYF